MRQIYQSQFRLPFSLYRKLHAAAIESGQSLNSALVDLLAESLVEPSDEVDLAIIAKALRRLSIRNPAIRYSIAIDLDETRRQVDHQRGG